MSVTMNDPVGMGQARVTHGALGIESVDSKGVLPEKKEILLEASSRCGVIPVSAVT